VFVLALLTSLGFAAEQRIETKDELTMRLLGARPPVEAGADVASEGAKASSGPKMVQPQALSPLPTVATVATVAAAQPVLPTVEALLPAKAVESAPQVVAKAKTAPVLPTAEGALPVAPSNTDLNQLLTEESTELLAPRLAPTFGQEASGLAEGEVASESEMSLPALPWWFPVALLGSLGLFLYTRKQGGLRPLGLGGAVAPMRVLSRTALGQNTGLALVELDDGDGGTRRVLVGFGGGSPNLVTELGAQRALELEEPAPAPVPAPVVLGRSPGPRIPSVEDFGFQATPKSPQLSTAPNPMALPSNPVVAPAVSTRSTGRRSVLSSKTRTLRAPDQKQDFSDVLRDEFEAPVPRRTADAARALVEEVLAERDPEENPEPPTRNARPWAGSRFQGTA
jgi:hypothetical protein